jgi:hypothetical protein
MKLHIKFKKKTDRNNHLDAHRNNHLDALCNLLVTNGIERPDFNKHDSWHALHGSLIKTDNDLKKVSIALKNNTSAVSLYLYNCNISDDGAIYIANIIRNNPKISILRLDNNKIGPKGAQIIAAALKNNSTISILEIHKNNIGPEGARAFAEIINTTKIKELNIDENNIGDKGMEAFVRVLGENTTLEKLSLYNNGINIDTVADDLVLALKKNYKLSELNTGSDYLDIYCGVKVTNVTNKISFNYHRQIYQETHTNKALNLRPWCTDSLLQKVDSCFMLTFPLFFQSYPKDIIFNIVSKAWGLKEGESCVNKLEGYNLEKFQNYLRRKPLEILEAQKASSIRIEEPTQNSCTTQNFCIREPKKGNIVIEEMVPRERKSLKPKAKPIEVPNTICNRLAESENKNKESGARRL